MAAGTQATDGRLCRPDRIDPIAARTGRTLATSSPSGVAMTSAIANPTNARLIDVHRIDHTRPSSTVAVNSSHTEIGAGTLYSLVIAEAQMSCQTAMNRTSATSGGSPTARARRHQGVVTTVGVSSASRPFSASAMSSSAGSRTSAPTSRGMAGDHLSEAGGDLVVQELAPVLRYVPLAHDRAGARGQQDHPLRQPHSLADVVGHEHDRRAGGFPDAQKLALQHVAGDRVE